MRACALPPPPPFPTPPGDATGEVGGADAAGRAPRREADGDGAGELSELRRAGGRLGEKGGTGGGRDGGREGRGKGGTGEGTDGQIIERDRGKGGTEGEERQGKEGQRV